jgi:predicted CopG family antitoxin
MHRTVTISLPEDVYQELRQLAGGGDVSRVIEQFVRPCRLTTEELAQA